ncbi:MAG TPA: class I SAM-dependent methyltransferase [Puia sp.]|nr:class I SAM-dependent methyltransferase [Puia sp.]
MVNNYDPLARYYDFLSRLVFGQTQVDAQVEMLDQVRPGDRVLIVGGGTGWILEKLVALYPDGLQITYVESSKVMIRLARRRKRGGHSVSFVQLPIEQLVTDERFDCILTGFLFDNFKQGHAEAIVRSLDNVLVNGAHWLNADFYYAPKGGTWWQWLLLHSMYWIVGGICRVEAKDLPDMEVCFGAVGYKVVRRSFYYQGFIQAVVYEKG